MRRQRDNYDWEEARRILNEGDEAPIETAPLPKISVDVKTLPAWGMRPLPSGTRKAPIDTVRFTGERPE